MQDLGQASEDEVIHAWLLAESASPRFAKYLIGVVVHGVHLAQDLQGALNIVNNLIHNGDLNDAAQNATRLELLSGFRGFGQGTLLFTGLANDIQWRRMHATTDEIGAMLYANQVAAWRTLAPNTLTVAEGASNVSLTPADDVNMHILAIARDICHANPMPVYPEIICLSRPDGRVSVMEGHSRATAYVLESHRLQGGTDLYLGTTPSAGNWHYL